VESDEIEKPQETVKVQKAISTAGFASRRRAEQLIDEGRVSINGKTVVKQGMRVLASDEIAVDGVPIKLGAGRHTYAFHKPKGVITAMSADKNTSKAARTLKDVLPKYALEQGVYLLGRLDYETSGLLLLTNDGTFANHISHPKYEIRKKYVVTILGSLTVNSRKALLSGVQLQDGMQKVDKLRKIGSSMTKNAKNSETYELALHSGKNRIIRRLFASLGHQVTELIRTEVGTQKLGNLKSGEIRKLTTDELRGMLNSGI
jgi:23S rRNA pseudouridine2605 synthase